MIINEFTHFEAVHSTDPETTNVFKSVKVLGLTSKNGYTYDPKAVANAITLYEHAPVYLNHLKKGHERDYQDRIGYIENAVIRENAVYADLILNPKHKLYETVLWDAMNGTTHVGLSHSIDGKLNSKTKIVESISRVYSVDLVSSPATTNSIFESEQQDNKMEEVTSTVEGLKTELTALKEQHAAVTTALQEVQAELKKLKSKRPEAIVPDATTKSQLTYERFIEKLKS